MSEAEFLRAYKPQSDQRMLFAVVVSTITLVVLVGIGIWIGEKGFWVGKSNLLSGLLIGIGTWIFLSTNGLRFFLVSVPEITALITINFFSKPTEGEPYKNLRPYPTGMHFKYPWEQVELGNYINLRLITADVTEDYPSQDGPMIKARWSFQYRARWWQLATYIAVDQTTITGGLRDVGSGFLSATIAKTDAVECKKTQAHIEKELQGFKFFLLFFNS